MENHKLKLHQSK